jgi:hypothetical protein
MASMYPLGGPRFRDGPRKVQAIQVHVSILPTTVNEEQ